MTHADWAEQHARLFGLTNDGAAAMLGEWCGLFCEEGYTADELLSATRWIAMNDPPRFPSDHLERLTVRLRTARRQAMARPADPNDRGTCTLCRGVGRVIVPLVPPIATVGGRCPPDDGVPRTIAVVCRCALGHHVRKQGDLSMLTLTEYERQVSDWKRIEEDWGKAQAKRSQITERTRALDKVFGSIMARVKAREPGEEG